MEQKTLEGYFADFNIEDPDVKMKIIPEINQMVFDRNQAIRKMDDPGAEEYQKEQMSQEVNELEEQIIKVIKKHLA